MITVEVKLSNAASSKNKMKISESCLKINRYRFGIIRQCKSLLNYLSIFKTKRNEKSKIGGECYNQAHIDIYSF